MKLTVVLWVLAIRLSLGGLRDVLRRGEATTHTLPATHDDG